MGALRQWIDLETLGEVAGVSPQRLRFVIHQGQGNAIHWRSSVLIVRHIHGRGGRSGRRYEVRLDSLPAELQLRFNALFSPSSLPLFGPSAGQERDWIYGLISPALKHENHSRERGSAIAEIAAQSHMHPNGKRQTLSARSIQRYIAAFEAQGLAGLGRRKRADAGEAAVILSRAWDKAVPFDDETKERLAEELRQYVRGLTKKGMNGAQLKLLAGTKLATLTRQAGFEPGEGAACCEVPQPFLEREKHFRNVYKFNTDRKAHDDERRARVRRTRDGLMPMDIVVADIHPIDIYCTRDDGSLATPRGIAWLDIATNRIFMDVVLLEKGEGITNAHVIGSFMRMVREWGCPRALYYDNGSEYNWMAFVGDALKLIDQQARSYFDRVEPWAERRSNIVQSLPYNAPAKPIEGIFKVLEQGYFRHIPGWVGGDRMRKKTANVGKAPEPFPGSFDELRGVIQAQLASYHAMPSGKRSSLKGLSPNGSLSKAIGAGWGMTVVNPDAFRVAFSRPEPRKLHQGVIRYAGRLWTSDALMAHQGNSVTLLVPHYEEPCRLAVLDDRDRFLCWIEPDVPFGFLETDGARESARRDRLQRQSLRDLDRSAPDLDVLEERRVAVAALPAPLTAPIVATIGPAEEHRELVEGMRETTTERADRQNREAQNHLKQRRALLERLKRKEIANG
jgi:hypothetical protein